MPQKVINLRTAHDIVDPCLLDEDGFAADWFLEWEQERQDICDEFFHVYYLDLAIIS